MNVIETIRLSLVFEKYGFFEKEESEKVTPEYEILSEIYQALSPEIKECLKENHEHYKGLPQDVIESFIEIHKKESEKIIDNKEKEPAVAPTTTSSGEKNIYLNKDNTTETGESQVSVKEKFAAEQYHNTKNRGLTSWNLYH